MICGQSLAPGLLPPSTLTAQRAGVRAPEACRPLAARPGSGPPLR